ncbi:MAG: hypothetical protein WDW38_010683 [Sanguina aurantia]
MGDSVHDELGGFVLDDDECMEAQGGSGGGEAGGRRRLSSGGRNGGGSSSVGGVVEDGGAVQEVVTEEVFEYQVRDVGGRWRAGSGADELLHGLGSGASGSGAGRRPSTRCWDDVSLPTSGGWAWAGGWSLSGSGGSSAVVLLRRQGLWIAGLDPAPQLLTHPPPLLARAPNARLRLAAPPLEASEEETPRHGRPFDSHPDSSTSPRRPDSHARPPPHPHSPTQPHVSASTMQHSGAGISSSSQDRAACNTGGAVDAVEGAGMHSAGGGSSDVASAAAATGHGNGVALAAPRVGVSGLNLLAVLLCSLLRGAQLQESKTIPPSDVQVFQDYLLPSLSLLPFDPEEAVRVEYAQGVAHLAAAAHQHLIRLQQGSNAAAADQQQQQQQQQLQAPNTQQPPLPRYDGQVAVLRLHMEKVVVELVTNIRTSAYIKRALLQHVVALARFFGRRDLNDLLLPLLITCLNAGEWALRSAFFTAVAAMGPYTGRESLDVFLLPCLEQALTDSEPSVVADAVMCIAAVATHLRKRSLMAAVTKVAPLLEHPSTAVRSAAVAMLASLLSPLLVGQPLLLADPVLLSSCLRSRQPPAQLQGGEVSESGGHHSERGSSSAGGANAPGSSPAQKINRHLMAVAAAGPSPRQHHSWGLLDGAMRSWGAARARGGCVKVLICDFG